MKFKKNSRGNFLIYQVMTVILVLLVVASVLMFIFKIDILSYLRNLPGYSTPEDEEFDVSGDFDIEIEGVITKTKVLEEYEKNKCKLNKYTCEVEEKCACFTKEQYESLETENPQMFSTCKSGEKCDDKGRGCVSEAIYTKQGILDCKEKLGSEFEQASVCELGNKATEICSCLGKLSVSNFF